MVRKASGLSEGLRTTPTQRTTKEKDFFVFNDIDLKRNRPVMAALPAGGVSGW
jgi:hypothetical protein